MHQAPHPTFPLYQAQAQNPALKRLFARLAEFERQRLDLNEQMIAALERDRTEPMTRSQSRALATHLRAGEQAQAEMPALVAQLSDESLYRTARMMVRDELLARKLMGTEVYAHSPEGLAFAEQITANLHAASSLLEPETFTGE